MARAPRVTVLMPVRDAAPFLGAAIDSVLRQTWTDLALLVVDDGSRDASAAIAARYATADARVRVERGPGAGLASALNAGLARIDSELIARADADDVNTPERLARQIALLDARPEIGVCGTAIRILPGGTRWVLPADSDALRATLLFGPPCYHPTVVVRREWLVRSGLRYATDAAHAEDYDLWERADRHTRFANLAAPLVRYRRHAGQVSATQAAAQTTATGAIQRRRLRALGLEPTDEELALHATVAAGHAPLDARRLAAARRWLERLRDVNRARAGYVEPAFSRVLAAYWYRTCAASIRAGAASPAELARTTLLEALPDRRRRLWRLRALHGVRRLVPRRP